MASSSPDKDGVKQIETPRSDQVALDLPMGDSLGAIIMALKLARQLERELAEITCEVIRYREDEADRDYQADQRASTPSSIAEKTEEPWAYAVHQPVGAEFDYLIFPDYGEAESHIADDEEGEERKIIPLFPRSAPSAIVPLSKSELVLLIDYHDNGESEADGMGVDQSAAYHRKRREHYAALLATLESARADDTAKEGT